jgi:ABC-type polysaccharide/polyol phosphate export permease
VNVFRRLRLLCTVHRELLFHLALKNLKVQYKYAFLGFLWAFFVPLCMALVFWFLFSFLYRRPIAPLSIVTALFVWQFVNASIAGSTSSLIDNAGILKKVYFPREIIPFSIVLSNFINFLLSLVVLIVLVIIYGFAKGIWMPLPPQIVFLPAIVVLTLIMVAGIVLVTSTLQVFYRDVKYVVEILLLVWFYFSGVFYEVDTVAIPAIKKGIPWLVNLFMLNPMVDLFCMYRLALLPSSIPDMVVDTSLYYPVWLMVLQAVAFSLVLFFFAYHLFMKRESELIDLI